MPSESMRELILLRPDASGPMVFTHREGFDWRRPAPPKPPAALKPPSTGPDWSPLIVNSWLDLLETRPANERLASSGDRRAMPVLGSAGGWPRWQLTDLNLADIPQHLGQPEHNFGERS
jgi:hypothetical protein